MTDRAQTPPHLFLETLKNGRPPETPVPVWLMRQAGRYSKAFRDLRAGKPFLEFCKQPELCTAATLIPLRETNVDAAILFADILLIPEAMGQSLEYVVGTGPVFADPIRSQEQIDQLSIPRMQDSINYVYETVDMLQDQLPEHIPLIGFAGAPFTVGSYMVEGRSSKDHRNIKEMMWAEDGRFDTLMTKLTDATIEYLQKQVENGALALQLFDTWLETLSPYDFERYVLPHVVRIFTELKALRVPTIYFAKGISKFRPWIDAIPCTAFGLDWTADISGFAQEYGNSRALQGNLDPATLYCPDEIIRKRVRETLRAVHPLKKYVFNLGHGLAPDMELSKVQFLVDTVHEESLKLEFED